MKRSITDGFRRYRIAIWILFGLLLFYTLAGFLIVPLVIQWGVVNQLPGLIQRKVALESARFNPYTLSVTLLNLAVTEKDDAPFMAARRLYLNAQLSSLLQRALIVKTVELDGADLRVVRMKEKRFNFSDFIPPPAAEEADKDAKPLRAVIGRLALTDGRVAIEDRAASTPFVTRWQAIEVRVHGFDTADGAEPAKFSLGAVSEAGETLNVEGQAAIAPLSVRADLRLAAVPLARYAPYYQPYFKGRITGGKFDVNAGAVWGQNSGRIDPIGLRIVDLQIAPADGDKAQPMVTLPHIEVAEAAVDLKNRTLAAGRIFTRDGRIALVRGADGRIDLFETLVDSPVVPAGTPQEQKPAVDSQPAWQVDLGEFQLEGYALDFNDFQLSDPPAHIQAHGISASAQGISTRPDTQAKVTFALLWSDRGHFNAEGTLTPSPLQAELKIDAAELDIRPVQAYISQFLNLTVNRGGAAAQGTLKIASRADQTMNIHYAGQAALNDLKTVGSGKNRDFISWKSLFLAGIDINSTPLKVSIDEIALTDFFKRLVVNADGTTNLGTILKPMARAAQTNQAATPDKEDRPGAIRIHTITFQGGTVDFRDRLVEPNVKAVLSDLGGHISGLASITESRAEVLLRGTTGPQIPFEISGQINPLIEKPFLNMKIVFANIDLSAYAPYSGKYLGYELDKGQLSLNLDYHLENNLLVGHNKVAVDQLTLGAPVKSPQATKLPVKLAIALLKDSKGNIDLDLPVKGSLDDPKFSLGSAILNVLQNLIVDIVSAPFKMLGALFGGGEELQYLQFEPGSAETTDAAREKLAILAKVLTERPALNLDIQGRIDPDADRNTLRRLRFERRLKNIKLRSLGRAVPIEEIEISPEERSALIRRAYEAADFPKPRDDKGNFKAITPDEMEKLLVTAIEISTDALHQLALARSNAAKNHLIDAGGIAAGRLFVVDPDIQGGAGEEKHTSQVQFRVK